MGNVRRNLTLDRSGGSSNCKSSIIRSYIWRRKTILPPTHYPVSKNPTEISFGDEPPSLGSWENSTKISTPLHQNIGNHTHSQDQTKKRNLEELAKKQKEQRNEIENTKKQLKKMKKTKQMIQFIPATKILFIPFLLPKSLLITLKIK